MKWQTVVLCGGLLVALTGVQTYRLVKEKQAHTQTKLDAEKRDRARVDAAFQKSEEYRKLEGDYAALLGDEQRKGAERLAEATAAAVAADVSRERMRDDYAAALRAALDRPTAEAGPDAGSRPPASQTADMLADVQRRLDEAAGGIALFADRSYAAATTCWDASKVGR